MTSRELRRQPILEAMIRVVGRKGYQATSVAAVVAEARASRATFYKYFDDKHDCFLAAYELAIERVVDAALEGCERARPWPEPARGGLAAIVGLFAGDPELARTAMVEFAAASDEARRRHWAAVGRLARLLDEGRRPRQPRLPPNTALMAVSGVAALIFDELRGPGGRPNCPACCRSSSSRCSSPSSGREPPPAPRSATPPSAGDDPVRWRHAWTQGSVRALPTPSGGRSSSSPTRRTSATSARRSRSAAAGLSLRSARPPQAIDREGMEAFVMGVGMATEMQDDPAEKPRAERLPQLAQAAEIGFSARSPAFTSTAAIAPSSRSRTRSTSSPSWVRQCPAWAELSIQPTCLRTSPTQNVSSK